MVSPEHVPRTPAGRDGLAKIIARPERSAIAVDFDGTLAPIVADPATARAHPAVLPALAALAPKVAAIAVITGRPAETAVRLGGFADAPGLDHLVVLGHYGAERWDAATGKVTAPPPHPGVVTTRDELPGVLAELNLTHDAYVEEKGGRAVAVHTRRASAPEAAFEALREPLAGLAARHGLIVEPGRLVLELRPPGVDKGVALTEYVREVGAESVLYAGDDLGDLPAFAAVEELRASHGVPGALVAADTVAPGLADRADVVLHGPAEVAELLRELADKLA